MQTLTMEPVGATASCPSLPSERGKAEDSDTQLRRQRRWGALFALAVLATGLTLVPLRVMGLTLTNLPGDVIDSHFNLYVLEHGWLWLTGKQPRFWDAPFFYPQPNVIAYSDSHLGTLPVYAAFRCLSLDRETAFQCWFLTLFVLNYAVCWWVLRRWRLGWAGAAAGAYLFAFGLPLIMQIGHVQLNPRFLVPPAAYFGVRLCRGGRARDWLGLGVCLVWQCYATIYVGYFLGLFLAAFLPIYAVLHWRTDLIAAFRRLGWEGLLPPLLLLLWAFASLPHQRRQGVALAGAGVLYAGWRYRELTWRSLGGGGWRQLLARAAIVAGCCLALMPLLKPYLALSRERGGRQPLEILCLLPRPASWLNPPAASLCWGRWHSDPDLRFFPHEHYLFLGIVPPCLLALVLAGLFFRQPREWRRLAAAAVLTFTVLLLFTLNLWGVSPYLQLIFLPGVSAIRAVSRIVLVLLFPAAIAVAWGIAVVQRWLARRRGAVFASLVAGAFVGLVIVDQAMDVSSFGGWTKHECQVRVAALAAEVLQCDPNARLFVDVRAEGRETPRDATCQQITAMAAAQRLGIPTLNGYSGWSPQGWTPFRRWQDYQAWKTAVVEHVGEARLRKHVPGYAQNGFMGLVILGELERDAK